MNVGKMKEERAEKYEEVVVMGDYEAGVDFGLEDSLEICILITICLPL